MIKPSDLTVQATPEIKSEIKSLMTPQALLLLDLYPKPEIITPSVVSSVDALFERRDDVRMLKLAPVKSVEAYHAYHAIEKDALVNEVHEMMGNSPLLLAQNKYPYMLPNTIGQYICWIKPEADDEQVVSFLSNVVQQYEITPAGLILFERPRHATMQLVRGTIKDIRHVHFWTYRKLLPL